MIHDPLDELPQSEAEWAIVKEIKKLRDATGWPVEVKRTPNGHVTISFATSLRTSPTTEQPEVTHRTGENASKPALDLTDLAKLVENSVGRFNELVNAPLRDTLRFNEVVEESRRSATRFLEEMDDARRSASLFQNVAGNPEFNSAARLLKQVEQSSTVGSAFRAVFGDIDRIARPFLN